MLLISVGNPVNPDSDKKLAKILTYLALPKPLKKPPKLFITAQ
jgi:hypothetical protein